MKKCVVLLFAMLICLASIGSYCEEGLASYYESYVPPSCPGSTEHGEHYASVNNELWQNGNICGHSFMINCTANCIDHSVGGPTIVVMAINQCGNCDGVTMMLSKSAFAYIGKLEAGSIPISYKYVF
ncbi:hypothetical protein KFK09_002158 [Dendrobium nobile]|uniref:Expansin-like EG45 domain-containing protein n=1 Tax=Dendrobium nobile TaxID=94219 RepID=A0A8T3CA99_DENNO|nr:hypothetical protein KFK09_002158 [Dendrobium nobile]